MTRINEGTPFLERRSTIVLLVVGIIAVEVGSAVVIVVSFSTWTDRASFGGMFGAVSSLFSGLALAGVVYAILLQRQELALQRQELELTRAELERAATAQEASAALLKQQLVISEEQLQRQSAETRRLIEDDRRRALPIFRVENCSYGGGRMDFELVNHGAPISDLEVLTANEASVRLVHTDVVPSGGVLKSAVTPEQRHRRARIHLCTGIHRCKRRTASD